MNLRNSYPEPSEVVMMASTWARFSLVRDHGHIRGIIHTATITTTMMITTLPYLCCTVTVHPQYWRIITAPAII